VVSEEFAVEFLYFCLEYMRPRAEVHRFPELTDVVRKRLWVLFTFLQDFLEGFFRQQADIFRKHREEAAHQEHRHVLCGIVLLFQRERDLGKALRNVARNLCRSLRRIERCRIEPDFSKAFADVFVA
jgi:hypothetical protein